MKILIVALSLSSIFFLSCKKTEGPGGSSSIKGTVISTNHQNARVEITEIITTNGLQVEHGDYWLINAVNSNQYFYIWYDNPTWISNGNPNLSGRTGVSVSFNYSDSNTEIAVNTATALEAATNGIFSIEVINDILRITNTELGNVPDADRVTTPFEFNIAQQGKNATLTASLPLIDEKVYLIYANNEFYDEVVRTDISGGFQFNWLKKGKYSVYVVSKDTINGGSKKIQFVTEVTKNKSQVNIGTLNTVN